MRRSFLEFNELPTLWQQTLNFCDSDGCKFFSLFMCVGEPLFRSIIWILGLLRDLESSVRNPTSMRRVAACCAARFCVQRLRQAARNCIFLLALSDCRDCGEHVEKMHPHPSCSSSISISNRFQKINGFFKHQYGWCQFQAGAKKFDERSAWLQIEIDQYSLCSWHRPKTLKISP
jgi:hypothetical protein